MIKVNTGTKIRNLKDEPFQINGVDIVISDIVIQVLQNSSTDARNKMMLMIKFSKENEDIDLTIDQAKVIIDLIVKESEKEFGVVSGRYYGNLMIYGRALEILESNEETKAA